MKLTIISDTHNHHKRITEDLPGGDLLIHAGDLSSMGYEHEIREFASWYHKLDGYHHKVFIAGNHDWGFQNNVEKVKRSLDYTILSHTSKMILLMLAMVTHMMKM